MRFLTVSGPPSSGKTSVILRVIEALQERQKKIGVVKFDCLLTDDDKRYAQKGVLVKKGLSGALCPDHYFVSNIESCVTWGHENDCEYLISESAGLCNRCSPHIQEITAVCVIDNLSGINTPRKSARCSNLPISLSSPKGISSPRRSAKSLPHGSSRLIRSGDHAR